VTAEDLWIEPASAAHARTSYYERPVLKEPVWIWAVPAYFYTGGVAGAAAVTGAAIQVAGRGAMRDLMKKCRVLAAAGTAVGTGLLIYDLGRPARFLNMLRVFRPTSVLNMGSWILGAAASSSAGALRFAGRPLGNLAGIASGVAGLPLSGYTAVLLSDTAVPVWQATRRSLPILFVASSLSSATSLLEATDLDEEEFAVVNRLGMIARVAELAAAVAVERDASRVDRVGRAFKSGLPGTLWKASTALTLASFGVSLVGGRRRPARVIDALLGTLGGIGLRFAVFEAGKQSARDPHATFDQQRA
jgi:formate-dependent nitrite reductase membrane component NrfD